MQHVGVDCVLLVMVLGFHSIVEGGSLLLTSVRCIMDLRWSLSCTFSEHLMLQRMERMDQPIHCDSLF